MKSVKTEELSKLFLVKPYLQLGQQFAVTTNEHYEVLWHTYDMEGDFQVQYRAYGETDNETGAQSWKPQVSLIPTLVRTSGSVAPHYRYQAVIGPIAAGKSFTYRVYRDKVKVFEASGKAAPRKPTNPGASSPSVTSEMVAKALAPMLTLFRRTSHSSCSYRATWSTTVAVSVSI
jgi:hypothetical protein